MLFLHVLTHSFPTRRSAYLRECAILRGVATFFVLIFRRLGLGAVLGYLIAGALVGPHGLGLVGGGESKLAFAEIGIAFLLFLVGLEFPPRRLWNLRREVFGPGFAQVFCPHADGVCLWKSVVIIWR